MRAPAATPSGACAIAIVEPITIGSTTPPAPQSVCANGARQISSTAAITPPSSLQAIASSNRRRSRPQLWLSE